MRPQFGRLEKVMNDKQGLSGHLLNHWDLQLGFHQWEVKPKQQAIAVGRRFLSPVIELFFGASFFTTCLRG